MSQALNGVSAGLAALATIFYIVGCVGYASEEDAIKNTNWINYAGDDDLLDIKVYVGLKKVLFTATNDYSTTFKFSSCANDDDNYDDDDNGLCSTCDETGKAAFGLLIISTILAFVVTCLSGATAASPNAPLTYANLVCSFVSGLFGVIGFGLFMHSCYNKVDDTTTVDLQYGPGAILSLIAFLMMWIVIVLQIAVAAMGGGAAKA
jgi:hypothetical protein